MKSTGTVDYRDHRDYSALPKPEKIPYGRSFQDRVIGTVPYKGIGYFHIPVMASEMPFRVVAGLEREVVFTPPYTAHRCVFFNRDLIERRHNNPTAQHEYDKQFGLTLP